MIKFNIRLVSGYTHVFILHALRCHCHSPRRHSARLRRVAPVT